jgi:hypothetical protein
MALNKMRNGDTPGAMLAQWFGRKCRNHKPLAELKIGERKFGTIPLGASRDQRAGVFTLSDDPETIIYSNGLVTYRIRIEEVDPDEMVEQLEAKLVLVAA